MYIHSVYTDFPREESEGSEKAALGEPCSSHLLNYQNTRAKAGDYSVQTYKCIECWPKFLSCDFLCSYLLAPRHGHWPTALLSGVTGLMNVLSLGVFMQTRDCQVEGHKVMLLQCNTTNEG